MSLPSESLGRAPPGEPSSTWQALEESNGRKAGSHGLSTPVFHGEEELACGKIPVLGGGTSGPAP